MRIRTIKPEFWTHPKYARLDDSLRLLCLALLNFADDEGYFYADPHLVREVQPFWDTDKIRRTIDEASRIGWIVIREHPDYGLVGKIENFSKHQRIDRGKESKIKNLWDSTNDRRTIDERSTLEQGTGNREQGTGIYMSGACEQAPDGTGDAESGNLPERQSAKKTSQNTETPEDPFILKYPVVGKSKTWGLNKSKRDEYVQIYADAAFVDHQLRDALQWLRDNPSRRKTPMGMTKFLGGWIRRNWDRNGGTRQEQGSTPRQPEPHGWRQAYDKLRQQYPKLEPLSPGESYHGLTPFAREEITNILKTK